MHFVLIKFIKDLFDSKSVEFFWREGRIFLMEVVRASALDLCRSERRWFDPRSTRGTFYHYRLLFTL